LSNLFGNSLDLGHIETCGGYGDCLHTANDQYKSFAKSKELTYFPVPSTAAVPNVAGAALVTVIVFVISFVTCDCPPCCLPFAPSSAAMISLRPLGSYVYP
jgi:hypothetical protein